MAALGMRISKGMMVAPFVVLLAGAGAAAPECSGDLTCSSGGGGGSAGRDQVLLQVSPLAHGDPADRDGSVGAQESGAHQALGEADAGAGGVQRRRRAENMQACRRRSSTPSKNPPEEATAEWQCRGDTMVYVGSGAPAPGPGDSEGCEGTSGGACLCVFDIDRTLTGKQGDTEKCPRNRVVGLRDRAYGGGEATLSALTAEGISTTFCDACVLGITSAGAGSGAGSEWNRFLLERVMRGEAHDAFVQAHPDAQVWSYGTDVRSPYVLNQGNRVKQESVELLRRWFGRRGVCVEPASVYFFGDRTENIEPFKEKGLNSREISCGSRDRRLYGGSGMVGYCGARPEEIQRVKGNLLCE